MVGRARGTATYDERLRDLESEAFHTGRTLAEQLAVVREQKRTAFGNIDSFADAVGAPGSGRPPSGWTRSNEFCSLSRVRRASTPPPSEFCPLEKLGSADNIVELLKVVAAWLQGGLHHL